MKRFLTLLFTLSFGFGSLAQDIDYYGPKPFGEVLKRSFEKTWTPKAISATGNIKYMILLDAAKTKALTFSSDADISTLSMTPIANLNASGATYGSMLRTVFQMVDLNAPLNKSTSPLSGTYRLNSFIHSYFALNAKDNNAAILSDRGTYYVAASTNTNKGYLGITFSGTTSATIIKASSKYTYDTSTSSFIKVASWTDKYLKINGTSVEWTSVVAEASSFFLADPNDLIDLEIEVGSDFNPASISYQQNAWAAFPANINPTATGFSDVSQKVDAAYQAQLAATTAAATAASTMLDKIETTLTTAGEKLRYPKAFYLALRENMLSHTIASTDVYGATLGDRSNKYVYFTNATDDSGVPHPFLVIASFAASTRPNQLVDVNRPPGDGAGGQYESQTVTRTTKAAEYLIKVPLKNYGLVETLLGNDLSVLGNLGKDAGETSQTVYNYASLGSNGIAVDGVPIYPSMNNTLVHAPNAAEVTHSGIHVGQGLELHYHADGHSYSKNGINLYNLADYVGRNHPPLIGMAYDGVALFGRYEDSNSTMKGYSTALDQFGGHDHGDSFGYHYHAHTQVVSNLEKNGSTTTFNQRFLLVGAWKGKINTIPGFLQVKTNQLVNTSYGRYAGASYQAVTPVTPVPPVTPDPPTVPPVPGTDTQAPVLVLKNPYKLVIPASGTAVLAASSLDNGSTDNVAITSIAISKSTFTCANLGANTVTVTAKDAAGNTATATVTINVVDEIKPTLKVKSTYTIKLDVAGKATLKWEDIDDSSTDNCSIKERKLSKTDFTRADGGDNKVTYTITDASGNTSSIETTIRVDIVLSAPERANQGNSIKAYPNPANEYLYLEFAEGVSTSAIRGSSLVDASGRVLGEIRLEEGGNGQLGFSTQELKAGMYFLRLSTRDTLHLIKFTVIH